MPNSTFLISFQSIMNYTIKLEIFKYITQEERLQFFFIQYAMHNLLKDFCNVETIYIT